MEAPENPCGKAYDMIEQIEHLQRLLILKLALLAFFNTIHIDKSGTAVG